MTELQNTDAPRPNLSTGPKTPEGKRRSSLNAYRHGLTGQLNIHSAEEQQAYDRHSQITLDSLAPFGDFERALAQSVADDRWRLNRARSIESGIFSLGFQALGSDDTGAPLVEEAFAQARTWLEDGRNLQLLTIYGQRIQRAVDKNMAELRTIQAQRKQQAQEAMRQAKLLYQLAEAEGKPYQPEDYFTFLPESREFVFSTPEVVRELRLSQRLNDAKIYDHNRAARPAAAAASANPIARQPDRPLETGSGR